MAVQLLFMQTQLLQSTSKIYKIYLRMTKTIATVEVCWHIIVQCLAAI